MLEVIKSLAKLENKCLEDIITAANKKIVNVAHLMTKYF